MHPYQHAISHPDRAAFVVADTGERLSYRELDEGSNRVAQLCRTLGLAAGDTIALMLQNGSDFPILYWGAQRSGLFVTLMSTHLKPEEAAYILNDCGAKLLFTSKAVGETPVALAANRSELIPAVQCVFSAGGDVLPGADPLASALAAMPSVPVPDQIAGFYILYSSGTTGRPKGIVLPFTPQPIEDIGLNEGSTRMFEGFDPLVAFNAGPLYHGAPIGGMIATHRLGGTVVTMRRFDALEALRAIQDWHVAHAQFVPTMFVRLLALPDEVRRGFDLSSLRFVLHAAAPCPMEIKRQMLDWWGPIIHEYYGASENFGGTSISPAEWLRRPGSVGRSALGPIHICREDGDELPAREQGLIYFESPPGRQFQYLNDPERTAGARHPAHPTWISVGDIGWIDEDGYLYLTDRKDFMIISGGVNIYPQAVENTLISHPRVLDAAVIGVPDAEYGERVLALVQPRCWDEAGDALSDELMTWCRRQISSVSCPRSIRFVSELPRLPSGKLAKHQLRKLYATTI
ncbi:MAG TPA: AMP-binding protein [Steroidobacteraceae bacterium]|jgi:fatty-acyl-CoA synthase|nr:AMP-binding protein [Steroidobacteraceae bacterium]